MKIFVETARTITLEDSLYLNSLGELVDIPSEADVILAAGGDGTMLTAIQLNQEYNIPFIGLNFGHVGFLLNDDRPNSPLEFENFVNSAKSYKLNLLGAVIEYEDGTTKDIYAFNDIYTASVKPGQSIKMNLTVNNRRVSGELVGDGVIVATPQGSTGYTRNAGGKIMKPGFPYIQLTTKSCTIGERRELTSSFIEPDDAIFKIEPIDFGFRPQAVLFDGMLVKFRESHIKSITISKSSKCATLLFNSKLGFYDKIYNLQYHE